MRLGAHESIAGGMPLAVERALADGCEAFQVFTRPGRSWLTRPLGRDEVDAFRKARRQAGTPVFAHASYLINLGGEPGPNREKSLDCLVTELERCELLGLFGLVLHPGGHPDEARGLALIKDALDEPSVKPARKSARKVPAKKAAKKAPAKKAAKKASATKAAASVAGD